MMSIVLLRGYLTKEILEGAFLELEEVASSCHRCTLVIDSDGGELRPALEFVKRARKLPVEFDVKVYNAQSAAAFIVITLGKSIEMKASTHLGFHRGDIKLELSDISPDGSIPKELHQAFRKYDRELGDALGEAGVDDPKLMASLYGSGWLNLSAEECLRYGIVQKLF